MANKVFAFKQFTIKQDKCAMKVGTDAVLLGAWTNPNGAQRILDIGTGTGIIALMLAQKTKASIDAIDIDADACLQARENVEGCKWKENIRVHHVPLQLHSQRQKDKYDLIVSNPPYFVDSSKALYIERTTARHTDLLPYKELLEGVLLLLAKNGKFCVILPFKEGEMFRDMAEKEKLYLSKMMRVKSRAGKATDKRLMMQFEFQRKTFSESSIVIEEDERHSYTDEYKELTRDYYLNF